MNRLDRLLASYRTYISIPWRHNAAADERVIFCVHAPEDELRLRARIDDFELVTRDAGHGWMLHDLTDVVAHWLPTLTYADDYLRKPLETPPADDLLAFITTRLATALQQHAPGDTDVVALHGVASLFGLLKVKQVVAAAATLVPGRLLVFFPGHYENNNYRLLDAYDGWGYHAVPITADKDA